MQKKGTGGRRRSTWTPADIGHADSWWRSRQPASGGSKGLGKETSPSGLEPDRREAAHDTPQPTPKIMPPPFPSPDGKLPVVPAHLSVHSDYLICMDCGERHRDLAPHLREAHQTDPDSYRHRWRLPVDYAMICPWDRMRR